MYNKNLIVGVILAGTIAITGTATAFAVKSDENLQNAPNTTVPARINPEKMHNRVKSALDGLVKEGKITPAQEEAVLKEIAPKKKKFEEKNKGTTSDGHRKSPLNDLITAGTITETQAVAIRNAFKSAIGSQKLMKEVLDSLVRAGTINQTQEDAVLKALPCKDGKCTFHGRKHGLLKDLVKAGTITQEQADAIKEAIKSAKDSGKKPE